MKKILCELEGKVICIWGFCLFFQNVISFVRRFKAKMLPFHAPALSAAEIQAAVDQVTRVGDRCPVFQYRLTPASGGTGTHIFSVGGIVTRVLAADANVNPPTQRRVEVEIVTGEGKGETLLLPPEPGQIEVIKLEFKIMEPNPYKRIHGGVAHPVDFRDPTTLVTYIVCRDTFSHQDQLRRFESDLREKHGMSRHDERSSGLQDYDSLRLNGLIRMYVSWVAGSQLLADWYKPQNVQIAIEIVMELEQHVILLEIAGTAGKKVSGENMYKRAKERWVQVVNIYELQKPEDKSWSRAVLESRKKAQH